MHGTPIQRMRSELTDVGVTELNTAEQVSHYFEEPKTCLLVFNSVCGCAAGSARPGIALALKEQPVESVSVFAGIDKEATQQARDIFSKYNPSSPSALLIVNGEAVYQLAREHIMGYTPQEVSEQLLDAFSKHLN